MTAIQEALERITVGEPVGGAELTMYPLLDPAAGESDYDLASQAFRRSTLEVTEVSETGSVPNLRVTNRGKRPVLLLDGEELVGAKQNRILNVTVMVPARKTIEVPVSCVEAGRWQYTSRDFTDADWVMDTEGRAAQMRSVSDSMRTGSRASDQGAVWSHIEAKSERLEAASPTGATGTMYSKHRKRLERSVNALKPAEGQVGAVFVSNGQLMGVELFDSHDTLKGVLPKLARSNALDSIDPRARRRQKTDLEVDAILESIRSLEAEEYPAVGLGQELRLRGKSVVGAALVVEKKVVHMAVLAE
ncbi:MAG: hypothetical protein JSW71_16540 [Gemmatimonadota bacterium]|nr:MAG: hypothetical protein JSW71_16540 [Gemmatimonadota bacterium]